MLLGNADQRSHPAEVVDDGGPVDVLPTSECVDRDTQWLQEIGCSIYTADSRRWTGFKSRPASSRTAYLAGPRCSDGESGSSAPPIDEMQ